nr:response regulator [uncultured Flavobacterium sp.]
MSSKIQILLVEDNMNDAELTIRALKKNNLANELTHVRDGAEALDFIFAQGRYFDRKMDDFPNVIILDLKMPKVNGIEVLRRIKSDERTKKIPVVMLTSSKEDPDIQECYRLGVNSYVVKPVEFNHFVKAITDLGLYWMILNQPPH